MPVVDEKPAVVTSPTSNGDGSHLKPNGTHKFAGNMDLPLETQFPRGESVAGDSIEELGDSEPKQYNEDGSFIGEYGHISSSTATTPPTDEAETPRSHTASIVAE